MLWMDIWVPPYTVIPVQVGLNFWKVGVWVRLNGVVVSWLRLQTASKGIPHPYHMCTKCFSTLICCGWTYGCTLTLSYCCKPPRYVPYKCTYVPYDGTFGTSDQGQTLDLWGWHPADVNAEVATPDVTTSSWKIPWTSQLISVGISDDLLDHTDWIQG
jgi:hypothetical protein